MQARHTCKHDNKGKQRVYAVRLSASPSYRDTVENEYQYRTQNGKGSTSVARDVIRQKSGTRPTDQGKSSFAHYE